MKNALGRVAGAGRLRWIPATTSAGVATLRGNDQDGGGARVAALRDFLSVGGSPGKEPTINSNSQLTMATRYNSVIQHRWGGRS